MINRIKKQLTREFWIYLIVGIVFLLAYSFAMLPPGQVIAGHDSGLPIDAKQFLKSRLYAWDDRVSFGTDNSPLFGSITLHFVDYASSLIAGGASGNWLNLFFWLAAMFLAAFIFAYQFKDLLGKYFVFLFPIISVFNFYLFQSIFILERAKYSILVATLLFLTLLFRVIAKKTSIVVASIVAAFVFLLFNAGSLLALPLYGSVLVLVVAIVIYYFIYGVLSKNLKSFLRLILFLFLTGSLLIPLSSYSFLPYLPGVLNKSYMIHLSSSVLQRSIDWVKYISQASSFTNVFRLQGIPSWYIGNFTVDPNHPYAELYATNPLLVVISFLFPILALGGIIFSKNNKQKTLLTLFALITLFSMFFVSGTHAPLGFIYEFLYNNLPGFEIFRTPYYKFANTYFIAFGVLLSFSISYLISRGSSLVKSKNLTKPLEYFFTFLFICIWMGYHFVLFNPAIVFSWDEQSSTKVTVPGYVNDFKRWFESEPSASSRILLLPPIDNIELGDGYNWGYWSLSPLPYSLTSATALSNELSLTNDERGWVNSLYEQIKLGNESKVNSLAAKLGVKEILLRKDATGPDSPDQYEALLESFKTVTKTQTFANWEVYQFINDPAPKISFIKSLSTVSGNPVYLSQNFLNGGNTATADKKTKETISSIVSNDVQSIPCESCLLEEKASLEKLPVVTILPNSLLYKLKEGRESLTLQTTTDEESKTDAYIGFIIRRTAEIKTMLDSDVDDRFIIPSLEKTNTYFDEIVKTPAIYRNNKLNFFRLKKLIDLLEITDTTLTGYFEDTEKFIHRSNVLKNQLGSILWKVNNLENLVADTGNPLFWKDKKLYFLNFSDGNTYKLFIRKNSLPLNESGEVVSPQISFVDSEVEAEVIDSGESGDWIEMAVSSDATNVVEMQLNFDRPPNLFKPRGDELRIFETGEKSCTTGSIDNFRNDRNYRIEVASSNPGQELRMYLRDSKKEVAENYTTGDRINVYFDQTPQGFVYYYHPTPQTNDVVILLCSDSENTRVDATISAYEIFNPEVLFVKETQVSEDNINLSVSYQKINPTKYSVTVRNAQKPFVLLFDERYSPLWKIDGLSEHFLVDGYANGWYVDRTGDYDFELTYAPQKYFYLGSAITLFSSVVILSVLVWLKRKSD